MDEIKMLAEKYLGAKVSQELFETKIPIAQRKLEWVIKREGDAAGERKKPYYLAQLVAEIIRSDVMTMCCMLNYEDKKRAAQNGQALKPQPHYSTSETNMSSNAMNF